MSDAMTALDARRQQAREARRALESATPGEDFINATDALLAAHRALVVAEMAGEGDVPAVLLSAIYRNLSCGCWSSPDFSDYPCSSCVGSAKEILKDLAPLLRAPLAAKLVEAEMERLRKMDEDNQFGYVALRLKLDAAEARVASLEAALQGMLNKYVSLVECGDCGNWDAEAELVVIQARAALGGPA